MTSELVYVVAVVATAEVATAEVAIAGGFQNPYDIQLYAAAHYYPFTQSLCTGGSGFELLCLI